MATYGYIRKENGHSMMEQLTAIFSYNCDELFVENESLTEFAEFENCLSKLENQDILVVASLSSIGQTVGSNLLTELIDIIKSRNVRFISIEEKLDTLTSPLFIEYWWLINKAEKKLQKDRIKVEKTFQKESYKQIEIRESHQETPLGRPGIRKHIVEQIRRLHLDKKPLREIAIICDVSLGTVQKYVKEFKKELM